jgi:cell division protease FtsH
MRSHSERTSREIDEEIKRIVDESIERVRHILEARREALEALTRRLIEVESIDAKELKQTIEDHSPGPLVVPGTVATPARRATGETVERQDRPLAEPGS